MTETQRQILQAILASLTRHLDALARSTLGPPSDERISRIINGLTATLEEVNNMLNEDDEDDPPPSEGAPN